MAKKNEESKLIRPSVWAQNKSINVSEGIMQQCHWETNHSYRDIVVNKTSGVGVKSHDGLAEKEMADANPYRGDTCYLDIDCDTIRMAFTVKILPIRNNINACNNYDYMQSLNDYIANTDNSVFKVLASSYLYNIYAGNFWWRNKLGAEQIVTKIAVKNRPTETIDSLEFCKNNTILNISDISEFLLSYVASAFAGETEYAELEVVSYLQAGFGSEVFPSQEMPENSMENRSKILFQRNGTAAMHSQKIGNAIRTIDTWYSEFDNYGLVIPVEPYGTSKNIGKAFRTGKESFYSLIDRAITEKDESLDFYQNMFIMACLIRGGVFGGKSK